MSGYRDDGFGGSPHNSPEFSAAVDRENESWREYQNSPNRDKPKNPCLPHMVTRDFDPEEYTVNRQGKRSTDRIEITYAPKGSPVGTCERVPLWLGDAFEAMLKLVSK